MQQRLAGSVGVTQGEMRVELREILPSGYQIRMNSLPGGRIFATLDDAKKRPLRQSKMARLAVT
jgi:hypothetical protein